MEERIKTSFAMRESVRRKLDVLQKRLRDAGVPRGEAHQSAILEALVMTADFETLRRYFER